jgi:hypothetical protein
MLDLLAMAARDVDEVTGYATPAAPDQGLF